MENLRKQRLLKKLLQIGVIQYGDFTLKSGKKSNLYFDFRKVYGHPKILLDIVEQIGEILDQNSKLDDTVICGVPTAGVPYASILSVHHIRPLISLRKEKKEYGMEKMIEGNYNPGDKIILIEDVITTGSSVLDAVQKLSEHDLKTICVITILDRREMDFDDENENENEDENDGWQKMANLFGTIDLNVISLLTLQDVKDFMKMPTAMMERKFHNSNAQNLWNIVLAKKTNLAVSLDTCNILNVIILLKQIGEYICMAKIHFDIFLDVNRNSVIEIYRLAHDMNFMIMDDRKYADIGSIVERQLQISRFHYGKMDYITVQSVFGPGTLSGLKIECQTGGIGCFLVAETSSKNSLITTEYSRRTIGLANEFQNIVSGFICQKTTGDEGFLHLTPGVNISEKDDSHHQGYRNVEKAVLEDGCDIIIVGRGIYEKTYYDQKHVTQTYQSQGWQALLKRYSKS